MKFSTAIFALTVAVAHACELAPSSPLVEKKIVKTPWAPAKEVHQLIKTDADGKKVLSITSDGVMMERHLEKNEGGVHFVVDEVVYNSLLGENNKEEFILDIARSLGDEFKEAAEEELKTLVIENGSDEHEIEEVDSSDSEEEDSGTVEEMVTVEDVDVDSETEEEE